MHKIAFVVPTKDRADELRRMLASLAAQSRRPDQVIVVDGSDPDIRHVVDEFPQLGCDYVRVFPPSLARQRNAGMQALKPEMTLAGYLDDDIVLEPDAVARMLTFWEAAAPDVGGAAFSITNTPLPNWIGIKRLFGIDDFRPGLVLASGCVSTLGSQPEDTEVEWLCGGATVWRRDVVDAYPYDDWFSGTGYMEDVDFSFNVGGRYRLMIVAGARLAHYSPPVRPDRQFLLGRWQIVNRMYFVRKHRQRGMSLARAWTASVAFAVLNAVYALRDRQYWARARGNCAGILDEFCGRRSQLGGFLK
jgi:glycosyltransferase involved in cell wall biosynthesis